MKRLMLSLTMLVCSALVVGEATWGAEIEVAAKKIKDADAPQIDGKVDKAWDAMRATKVTASEGPQGKVEISLKVLYTDKDIFFLFQWPDKTMSMSRVFEFDGKEWKKTKGNEDYFALQWDIGNTVKDFPKKGCAINCHKADKKLFLRTNAPGERIDIWFHKPQRTNPVGQADDQYLTHELKKGENSARRTDSKTSGGYEENWVKEAKRPKYTFREGVKPGPVLLKKDAVEIKDSSKFKAGDRLPREVLAPFVGSRGDIQTGAVWEKGRWTLEMKRARATEDKENDIQFTDPGRPYYFGISVWDDEDDENHSHTGETVLRLTVK